MVKSLKAALYKKQYWTVKLMAKQTKNFGKFLEPLKRNSFVSIYSIHMQKKIGKECDLFLGAMNYTFE